MEESTQTEQQQAEAKPEAKSKPSPKLIIGLVVVAVLVAVGYFAFGKGGYQTPAPATPGSGVEETVVKEDGDAIEEEEGAMVEAREIVVEGDQFSFSPASISVKAGERVKLTFNNVGSIPHNFTVEGLGVATRTISAGQSSTIEFTVEEGGTYTTFCSVGTHRTQGMEGTLNVE